MSVAWSMEQGANATPLYWSENEALLQNLAHDLRQPLSDIDAIAYYLQTSTAVDRAGAHQLLDRIQVLVERANEILSTALQNARHKTGVIDSQSPSAGA